MKFQVLSVLALFISSASFASFNYSCAGLNGDEEIQVDSGTRAEANATEWGPLSYFARFDDGRSPSITMQVGSADDLAPTQIVVGRALIRGMQYGYAMFIGGESDSRGWMNCKRFR